MHSDPVQLGRVLNLLSNAAKFTEKELFDSRCASPGEGAEASVIFRFVDTGIGMRSARLRFFNSSLLRTHRPPAASAHWALLSITKAICSLLAAIFGKCTGRGTTFEMRLPAAGLPQCARERDLCCHGATHPRSGG